MVQENFLFCDQRSPNGARKQERSPSGARAEPERSTGPRKEHATPKGRSKAGAGPEQSPSGARTEHRTPKRVRDSETTLGVLKLHYLETAESPVIPGRLNASQTSQTLVLVCLSIWGPVRSLYARPTSFRGLRCSCLIIC